MPYHARICVILIEVSVNKGEKCFDTMYVVKAKSMNPFPDSGLVKLLVIAYTYNLI